MYTEYFNSFAILTNQTAIFEGFDKSLFLLHMQKASVSSATSVAMQQISQNHGKRNNCHMTTCHT